MNRELLVRKIDAAGIKYYKMAAELGLSRTGFALKLRGENDFKMGEITKICSILKLNAAERDEIFFADCVG